MAAAEFDDEATDALYVDGASDARPKLRKWLRFIETEADEDVTVTLVHKSKLADREVDQFIFELGVAMKVDDFVDEILKVATADALEFRGTIGYAITSDKKPGRCPFTLKVPMREDSDDEEFTDELPNQRGILHQSMRHTEAMTNFALTSMRMLKESLKEEVRGMREENAFLKRHDFARTQATEQVLSLAFERKLKEEEHIEKKQMRGKALDMAGKLLPAVSAHLMGGATRIAAIQQRSPIDDTIVSLFSSLETQPDKLAAVMQILDGGDVALIAQLHEYAAKRRQQQAAEEEDAAAKAAAVDKARAGGGQPAQGGSGA